MVLVSKNSHPEMILIKEKGNMKHHSVNSMLKLDVKDRLCKIMVNQKSQTTGDLQ
jgi:hypothetical protein